MAALAAWADGPYRQAFGAKTLTIAVVTPEEARRGQQQLAEIFLVTSADPVTTPPSQLFFGRLRYEPVHAEPVSLVLSPPPPVVSVQVPGKQVWPAGS